MDKTLPPELADAKRRDTVEGFNDLLLDRVLELESEKADLLAELNAYRSCLEPDIMAPIPDEIRVNVPNWAMPTGDVPRYVLMDEYEE